MLIRLFALLSYLLTSGAMMYFIGFLQNWTPKGIDTPALFEGGWLINLVMLLAFGVGHSLLARPSVKQLLYGSPDAKFGRSLYNLVAGVQLALLVAFWTPMTNAVWQVDAGPGAGLIYVLFAFGWTLMFAAIFAIDMWHFFGFRQAFIDIPAEPPFSVRGPYRLIRHPIQTGVIIALWATPHMTTGHALMATFLTVYSILATLGLEERDLLAQLGSDYEDYRRNVPALLPKLFGRRR